MMKTLIIILFGAIALYAGDLHNWHVLRGRCNYTGCSTMWIISTTEATGCTCEKPVQTVDATCSVHAEGGQ